MTASGDEASNSPKNTPYDDTWKEALEKYLPAFLALCFPDLHQIIDWSQPYRSLDAQLQEIVRDAKLGTRLADKLFQVTLVEGVTTWLLIHVEAQGYYEAKFAERMFIYNYRIFDRFRHQVISLAVLGDETRSWRPTSYSYGQAGAKMTLEFLMVKLLDFEQRWSELEISSNLFAPIVMAHLKSKATTREPATRAEWKLRVVRGLYQRGYQRSDILELFRIIDWMMVLPEELQQEFKRQLQEIREETEMPLLSQIELMAQEKGREEGKKEGREEVALNFLRMGLGVEQVAQGTGLSLEQIQKLQAKLDEQ